MKAKKDSSPVVITGIGLSTALGTEKTKIWHNLICGKNGVRPLKGPNTRFNKYGIQMAGFVDDLGLDLPQITAKQKKLFKGCNRVSRMCLKAGISALEDAGINVPVDSDQSRIGIVHSTGTYVEDECTQAHFETLTPIWYLKTYPGIHLSYLSILMAAKGYCSTLVSACEGGTQAIGNAYKLIKNGDCEIMLAGGTDCKFTDMFVSGFTRLQMVNTSNNQLTGMRPFDKDRNGFIMGEGAGFLVLESLSHAEKRNVKPYCTIAGYGNSPDSFHPVDASRDGKFRAMKAALLDAGIEPGKINYINAHGTSTQSNDREETLAIKKLLGMHAYSVPVNSSKSMLGHTFAAAGAIEAAICSLTLLHQKVHPTLNFFEGDEICDLNYVRDRSQDIDLEYCMSNSSGIGGFNSSLILKRMK